VQLQLAIPAGCLTAIVGEVGSGKSSLLAALLGELELVSGCAKLPSQRRQQQQQQRQQHAARIGYVGQSPWVMRGSVRDNVLMGQPYDAEFMGEVNWWLVITHCWVCYVAHWVMRGSVRDNVLMGQPYDAELMGEVSWWLCMFC
jgi:ABC-type sugar transport system ATPase subunit